jgi:O-antigen/teichoic acid export membrane protein
MTAPEAGGKTGARRGETFLKNVLWNWSGVAVSLFAGLILSPYIIRKLGADGYGIWSLVFSITGYYNLLDLGFRSAIVRYSAHFRATGEDGKINELVNTTLAYFTAIAIVLIAMTLLLARKATGFFDVSSHYHDQFSTLIGIVGISLAVGIPFNVFTGCVEGYQRFDISNRIWIFTYGLRYLGCAALLSRGYGLVEMGLLALFTQVLLCFLYFASFRKIFPALRFSPALVKRDMLRRIAGFGLHTFLAGVSTQSLDQTPSVLIGHFQPIAFVGYYNLPLRLLQYAADAVSRVGLVVAPKAAELAAQGRLDTVARLAIFANRYSFTLYTPFAIVLLAYGPDVIRVWLKEKGPDFALHSGPLLPILLLAMAFTMAGQYSSSTVLFGLGKNRGYAWSVALEAAASAGAMLVAIPRFGILGAAVVSAFLMIGIRGLLTAWLVCSSINMRFGTYMASIYTRPVLTALPVLALAYWMRSHLMAGRNWTELIAASSLLGGLYLSAAFFTCLDVEHRNLLLAWLRRWRMVRERAA